MMSNMLQAGAEFLKDKLHAAASRSITYTRGANSVALTAVIGRTPFRVQSSGPGGARSQITWSERDYLIAAAELILGGSLTTPQKGDQITDSDGTFELVSINAEPCYRNSDPYGIQLRCHTKRIGD